VRPLGIVSLARASSQDLFDQSTAFGRLALVHVFMMAGDTLVTVSLAGSLFFSVSPARRRARSCCTCSSPSRPFAIVSPVLGPLIDRSANGRRILVALSAGVRSGAVLDDGRAPQLVMALSAGLFLLLVSSKLYVVTRGALVPEMARTDQFREHAAHLGDAGWPNDEQDEEKGFAGFNAQLTLLGTIVGLLAGSIGAGLLKGLGGPSVLVTASIVYIAATVASARLQRPAKVIRDQVSGLTQTQRDLNALNPLGDVEVAWGLGAAALMRFSVGFATFLLAFVLRTRVGPLWVGTPSHSPSALWVRSWGWPLSRARATSSRSRRCSEWRCWPPEWAAVAASTDPVLWAQVVFAGWLGLCAAVAQPSFDAITQRNVAPGAQGRTFARFAVRQQLLWVVGALIPVAIAMSFFDGGPNPRLL